MRNTTDQKGYDLFMYFFQLLKEYFYSLFRLFAGDFITLNFGRDIL